MSPRLRSGRTLMSVLVLLLLATAIASTGGQQTSPEVLRPLPKTVPQRQWEYAQLPCMPSNGIIEGPQSSLTAQLNEYGMRGWEAVGLLAVQESLQAQSRECVVALLKRERVH